MALLNKHGRLTIDPCILNSAQEIVNYAKEVARKSDHVASDLLITAVWCCMNCSCSRSNKTDGTVRSDSQAKGGKGQTCSDIKHDKSSAKEKSPEQRVTSNRTNSTEVQENKLEERPKSDQKQSKPDAPSDEIGDGCSVETATSTSSVHDQNTKIDKVNEKGTSKEDGVKNLGVSDEDCDKDKGDNTDSIKPGYTGDIDNSIQAVERSIQATETEIVDDVILLDNNDHGNEDDIGEPDDHQPSEEQSIVSKSGIVIEKEKDAKSPENNDQYYFDMDCDEIEDDQLFDNGHSDISKVDTNKDEIEADDEVTIISDDENVEVEKNSGAKPKSNERDAKGKEISNKHTDKPDNRFTGNKSDVKKSKSAVEKSKFGKGNKTDDKKKEFDSDIEIITLDSDSESDEQISSEQSSKRELSKSDGSSVKKESGIDIEQMSAFTCPVMEELDGMSVSILNNKNSLKKGSETGKSEPTKADTHGKNCDNMEFEESQSGVQTLSGIKVEDLSADSQPSHPPGSSEFGPAVIGLVPNNMVQDPTHQPNTITATTITFYSAGPSWGSFQEQTMPYMVHTSQEVVAGNSTDGPPSKKRLLDFDKKWHMEPKLDRHHDRYLALPGGIEGNSVDNFEDRQRKMATRNKASDWSDSDNDYPLTPSVVMETVGEGNGQKLIEYEQEIESSETDESEKDSDENSTKTERKQTTKLRGRLKSGHSTRGRMKTNTGRGTNKGSVDTLRGASRGRPRGRGQRARGRLAVSGRGRGRGRGGSSPSLSQESPGKGAAGMNWMRIGFYSVRRGTGGRSRSRGGRGQPRGGRGLPRGGRARGRGQSSSRGMANRSRGTEGNRRGRPRGSKRRGTKE